MEVFNPCNFSTIQGYPHDFPQVGMDELPSFQGNDAVSVKSHLFAFANWWNKFAVANNNFDDVKMRLFVLTFGQDVADWFTENLIIHLIPLNQLWLSLRTCKVIKGKISIWLEISAS